LENAEIAECPFLVQKEVHPNHKNGSDRRRKDIPDSDKFCKAYGYYQINKCSKETNAGPFEHLDPCGVVIYNPKIECEFTVYGEVVNAHQTDHTDGRRNIVQSPNLSKDKKQYSVQEDCCCVEKRESQDFIFIHLAITTF
jgi:hypothetical protein